MPEEKSSPDKLDELIERVDFIEQTLRQQLARLHAIEQRLGLTYRPMKTRGPQPAGREKPPEPVTPVRPEQPKPVQPEVEIAKPEAKPIQPEVESIKPQPVKPEVIIPPAIPIETPPTVIASSEPIPPPRLEKPVATTPVPKATEPFPQTQATASRQSGVEWRDLESRIGGRWLLWIGILAISLGVAFFLRLAIESGWIGPWGRVSIGVIAGIAFLAGAERLRARYPVYAYGLSGGGVAILYLSFFASFRLYNLIPQLAAFALLAIVTALASLLAARYNALPIAVLGLIGGFLTPILLSTGRDNQVGLFSYIALLDLGVLALAYSKHWRVINYLSFTSTVLLFAGWYIRHYDGPAELWTTIFFLTLFFVIFALVAVLYNVINRQPVRWLDLILVLANGSLYFASSYQLLEESYRQFLGLFAVLVAGFYLVLGYFTFKRDSEDRLLIYTFLGLAFLFIGLAVPIQFDQHWVTMGWAIEGLVMTWIGLKVGDRTSRYAALLLFGISIGHWLLIDVSQFAYKEWLYFIPIFNRRALSCAVMIASFAAAAWLYKNPETKVEEEEKSIFLTLYTLAANLLAITLLSLDANDYFDQRKALAVAEGGDYSGRLNPLDNTRHLTLSALWVIYATMTLIVGLMRKSKLLRVGALVLLAAATLRAFVFDLPYYTARWHNTIFNETFAIFALLTLATAICAWFYSRSKNIEEKERVAMTTVLVCAANLLALVTLSIETLGHFKRAISLTEENIVAAQLENNKQFILSVIWILHGAAALIVGIIRKYGILRAGALGLLGVAMAKVVVVDLRFFDASWHTLIFNQTFGAFALLIAALAVGLRFYKREQSIDNDERTTIIPLLIVAVNLLTFIMLSAEAIGYFERALTATQEAIAKERLENNKYFVLSVIWILHGGVALIVGILRNSKLLRRGALGFLFLVAIKVMVVDLSYYAASWHTLVFNQTFGAFALLVATLACCIRFYSRAQDIDGKEKSALLPLLIAAANLLAVVMLSAEALGYFERVEVTMISQSASSVQMTSLHSAKQLALSVIWTVYSAAALVVGVRRNSKLLRVGAFALLALTTIKLLTVDLTYYDAAGRALIFNPTFAAFALLVAAIALGVWLYSRNKQIGEGERSVMITALTIAGNLLAIIALSAEAIGYFEAQVVNNIASGESSYDLRLAQQLSLSLVWIVYGGGMLTVGIIRRNRLLRVMALLLVGITIFKVFLFDLASLERVYRIISFIVLGVILLAVSFLYQRLRWLTMDEDAARNAQPPVSADD
jgi:uncharacterized membrane protein